LGEVPLYKIIIAPGKVVEPLIEVAVVSTFPAALVVIIGACMKSLTAKPVDTVMHKALAWAYTFKVSPL
jgi:hypothetical protein